MAHPSPIPTRHAADAPGCLIHIGMPKTATTMLQHAVFEHHPDVTYLGKFEGHPNYRDEDLDGFVRRRFRLPGNPQARCFRDLAARIDDYRRQERVVVFSEEAFTGGDIELKRRQAEGFRRTFGEARILMTIREPLSFMEALYFQELKGFQFKPQKYQRLRKHFGHPPRYFDINQWLGCLWTRQSRSSLTHLAVADTAEVYADVFGRENVHILIFEDLKVNAERFLTDVSRVAGICPEESCRLGSQRSKNVRWRESQIARLKSFNDSFIRRAQYRWIKSKRELKEALGLAGTLPDDASPTARAALSEEWREKLLDVARPQFERLGQEWQLPLHDYGYPVPSTGETTIRARAA